MQEHAFHPLVSQWFETRFGAPTDPQRLGWPAIAAGNHTLIAAPTGSGKTLAAFLVCIDRLWRDWLAGRLPSGIHVVYVSPLKALSNDIDRNLQSPLAEISALAAASGLEPPPIRTAVRTGDTPHAARQAMLRNPPHILVTTPESLYLLLTSPRGRDLLRPVKTVIVDEIHALARDKRGSHLALSLERLAALADQRPVRIGLSATQRPIDQIARFLVGSNCRQVHVIESRAAAADPKAADSEPADSEPAAPMPAAAAGDVVAGGIPEDVFVVNSGHARQLDVMIETPPSDLSAVCSHEQWDEVYARLVELIRQHRSTLIFVNTRRLAERIAHRLREVLGDDAVAGHHGSLSRERRLDAEQRLKNGQLKAIVATASLEMGIDIGYIDLVCQVGSPRSIATFLQRVGRSGHCLGLVPKGRLFPLTRDELLESMALIRAVHRGQLDQIEIPHAPLDILAQQIVAAVACEPWNEAELFKMVRRASPYRDLSQQDFDAIVTLLSEGLTRHNRRGAYLHRDRINHQLRARRQARLAAITSGGAIPETAEYRVIAQPDDVFVGRVDEDFAIESMAGDVFLLGNTSWRVQWIREGQVVVRDAGGAPPSIPFWFGEAPGRTVELSEEISRLRTDIADGLLGGSSAAVDGAAAATIPESLAWLPAECGVDPRAAAQAVEYIRAEVGAIGLVPTSRNIVFERFFDESGGMQLVIHAPLGARINRAWGLAMRKRFCRSFDFELQAAATDNGILLSIGPQHSFPIESLFRMLGPHNAEALLKQAVLAAPMFQVRWRWNVTRALAVLRNQAGKKVPPHLQRFRSDDLLAAAFPETVGCLENHHGDVEIPDHPLVRQTMHDCLTEAMDVQRWIGVLREVQAGEVHLTARDTREPSPFCYELLNANPYAFLDDAPLEERRTRAVATRRGFTAEDIRDLARLDPAAIAAVRQEAWPLVRDADELHDTLLGMTLLPAGEGSAWRAWFATLVAAGRAATLAAGERQFWIAAESWPAARALFPDAAVTPRLSLRPDLDTTVDRAEALAAVLRGRLQVCGPATAGDLARQFGIREDQIMASLEALEGRGVVLRGRFEDPAPGGGAEAAVQWCDRRLLARIHRRTMDGLRRRIKPVSPEDFVRFLARHHRLTRDSRWVGQTGVREAVAQLQGFDLPAGLWEPAVLAARVDDYDPQWLDQLFLAGEVTWGRLRVPRRDESQTSRAAITRAMPISLILRSELNWLVPRDDQGADEQQDAAAGQGLSLRTRRALEALRSKGALFFAELAAVAELLPTELEEALRELAAAGLVTSDGFAPIRGMVAGRRSGGHWQRGRRAIHGLAAAAGGAPSGRWSCFPGHLGPAPDVERRIDNWCRLLLRRYGVVFRDLLARESAAPSWRELVQAFRRLELRGDVRGGRFVSGVGGEQFADEAAVEALRSIRESPADETWLLVSAVDPLNVSGIVTDGPRIAAMHKNALILRNGTCVAARQANEIVFLHDVAPEVAGAMRRALQTGRVDPASHIRPEWIAGASRPVRPGSELPAVPSRTMRQ